MPRHADPTADDLLRAMRDAGSECPVCRLTQQAVTLYLDKFSYESVNDPGVRAPLRKALGFCAPHNRQWLGQQDMLGTSIIYRDIFLHVLKLLAPLGVSPDEAGQRGGSGGGLLFIFRTFLRTGRLSKGTEVGHALSVALEPRESCPACRHSMEVEGRLVRSCAQALEHAEFMASYVTHETGLCLPHLRSILRILKTAQVALSLAREQSKKWARTRVELEEVIRKFDYRYTSEAKGDEFKAPARGMEQASGHLPTYLNMPGSRYG